MKTPTAVAIDGQTKMKWEILAFHTNHAIENRPMNRSEYFRWRIASDWNEFIKIHPEFKERECGSS